MSKPAFIERDLSWLSFNQRVLQEAADPRVPLYERLKFLAIYSSNLDEFFRVRVSAMRSFKDLKKKTRKQLEVEPKAILKKIKTIVGQQQNEFGRLFEKEILPKLAKRGIHLVQETAFTKAQATFAKEFFAEKVKAHLKPVFLNKKDDTVFLENKALYLVVQLDKVGKRLVVVNIPSDEVGRFVVLPKKGKAHCITFLDEIIRYNLSDLFSDEKIRGVYSVKLSRDAELYLGDEFDGDLMKKLKKSIAKRKTGLPTRFLYDHKIPNVLLSRLKSLLNLSKYDLVPGARYHNFNDFFGFPDPSNQADLHNPDMPPHQHKALEKEKSLLRAIKQQDYILHFPYQMYDYVPKMIFEAAADKKVEEIKITLYRVASKSDVANALLEALGKGKKVTVFIEAKARFDEASNLYWGEQLEKAGATVMYSYPGIKVHTKLLLIRRREGENLKNYAYIGTGNFNEKTAKLYCDHALLTADARLADEVVQVFELLDRKIIVPKTKHIFISPFTTRSGFEKLITKEIKNAKAGKEAYMILKMNSLEDRGMIEKLYEASKAGVKIQLIVRGICSLVPGMKGLSENIEVISVIDRFLEHSRVYIFCNGGKEKMYLASADWMTRNLDRRIEVVFPIYDPKIYQELREIIDIQLADNVKARIINPIHSNHYVKNKEAEVRSQMAIYEFLK
nr:polyphosphate kinase [uncultured bacterium]